MYNDQRRCQSCASSCRGTAPACPRLAPRPRPLDVRRCAPESADIAGAADPPRRRPACPGIAVSAVPPIAMAAAFGHPLPRWTNRVRMIFRSLKVLRLALQRPLRLSEECICARWLVPLGGMKARITLAKEGVSDRRIDPVCEEVRSVRFAGRARVRSALRLCANVLGERACLERLAHPLHHRPRQPLRLAFTAGFGVDDHLGLAVGDGHTVRARSRVYS
jgi:hypothetical protein